MLLEGASHVVAEVAAELGREEPQQSPEDAFAARHMSGPPEERLAPRDGDCLLEPCGFRARDVFAKRRQ